MFESDIMTVLLSRLCTQFYKQQCDRDTAFVWLALFVLCLLSVHALRLCLYLLPHTFIRSHNRVGGCSWTFALQHGAGSAPANPVARQSKPITVWGQMVNPCNIHFPASVSAFTCHPKSRVMHQDPVSQATQSELAQFIKPGLVHKPEFTRRRHLQQTAAAHSWWEG